MKFCFLKAKHTKIYDFEWGIRLHKPLNGNQNWTILVTIRSPDRSYQDLDNLFDPFRSFLPVVRFCVRKHLGFPRVRKCLPLKLICLQLVICIVYFFLEIETQTLKIEFDFWLRIKIVKFCKRRKEKKKKEKRISNRYQILLSVRLRSSICNC